MICRHITYTVFLSVLLIGCQGDQNDQDYSGSATLMELIPSSVTHVSFENEVYEDAEHHIGAYDYLYNGGGVAVGDLNNDGLPDLVFTGNSVGNKMYFNKGNFEFEDVTETSGIDGKLWSTGVSMVDINNDGWLDIYICNGGPSWHSTDRRNQLYINRGNGEFTDVARQMGVDNNGYSTQASFFDYDRDGDLDLFVMNHMSMFIPEKHLIFQRLREMSPDDYKEQCSALYRNNGNATFDDVSESAGILKAGYGLGLAISDLNNDGWLDIYVANDFFIPDFCWINAGNGQFNDEIKPRTGHISYFSMGCDAADINNDGWFDLAVLDMSPGDHKRSKVLMASMDVETFSALTEDLKYEPQYMLNVLQLNRGGGYFSEIGGMLKVAKTDWSWGALLADLDNDGWKDYFVTNGYKRDTKNNDYRVKLAQLIKENGGQLKPGQYYELLEDLVDQVPLPNFLFKNQGGLKFEDYSENWGMTQPSFSNGAAYADLDADGDIDLVINNIEDEAHIYRNRAIETNAGNYLQVELQSENPAQALHAKVSINSGGLNQQWQENSTVRGYQSGMEPILHFGLGELETIDELRIDWLDGSNSIIKNLDANQRILVDKESISLSQDKPTLPKPAFRDITAQIFDGQFTHIENDFDDFKNEILLPHRQSTLGPCLAVGDVNGDQAQDFFIGGASGQSGILYLQAPDASFKASSFQPWHLHRNSEDMGSAFFDFDNDGDLDLYVASGGGGEMVGNERFLQDRLYKNDGTGKFEHIDILPPLLSSGGRVKPADFDNDGDIDLFVCGRTAPGKYPYPGHSYILRNENGRFVDATSEVASGLSDIGMVTDARWEDLDSDARLDLIVIGEWMPITVFKNNGQSLVAQKSPSLEMTKGWWYAIEGSDFDGDGDTDFLVGNLGENNKFGPKPESPLHVYANDFDDNGTLDIVLSKKYEDYLVPVRGKECSSQQMPFVSEKFETYDAFANASLDEIYTKGKLKNALHYEAKSFSSVYLENEGNFEFSVHNLPSAAQMGPINGIVIKDFDKDGKLDVVVAGGMLNTEVETPSYDANIGLWLRGEGGHKFEPVSIAFESGVFLNRNVKELASIGLGPNKIPAIIVANNNNPMQVIVFQR